jgi:hypothetical protein
MRASFATHRAMRGADAACGAGDATRVTAAARLPA